MRRGIMGNWLGRFISVDTLNEKYLELSAYQYASNRPVTMIDLDGLEGVEMQYVRDGEVHSQFMTEESVELSEVEVKPKSW